MIYPQDSRIQKIMEAVELLKLEDQQLEKIEAYVSGQETGETLSQIPFQDLYKISGETAERFCVLFRELIGKNRIEDAEKLFTVIFAIGKSTSSRLFPKEIMMSRGMSVLMFRPAWGASIYAEVVGQNENWLQAHVLQSLLKIADKNPQIISEAIQYHKGPYSNGLIILYSLYFYLKYPEDDKNLILQEDKAMMKRYEDIIINSLDKLFLNGISPEKLRELICAAKTGHLADRVLKPVQGASTAGFFMTLLGGCSFINYTLSASLKSVVSICMAANLNKMLAIMERLDLRMDLRVRGGSFDQVFHIDPQKLISWAAIKKYKNILRKQFDQNSQIFLTCMDEADFSSFDAMLSVAKEKDKSLFEKEIEKARGKKRLQIIHGLISELTPGSPEYNAAKTYLEGEAGIETLYPHEIPLVSKLSYRGYQQREMLKSYEKLYEGDEFIRRFLAFLIFRQQSTYNLYLNLFEDKREEVLQQKTEAFFQMLHKEQLGFSYQLKGACLINEHAQYDSRQSVFAEKIKEIFRTYLKERPGEMKTTFREADAAGRLMGLLVMETDPEQNKEEILSYTVDSSKMVKEELLKILIKQKTWKEEIKNLLASKKAAERELGIRVFLAWKDADCTEVLQGMLEKEKNAKVRKLLGDSLQLENVQGDGQVFTREDLVKELHKGGKKRSLAWAYASPFSQVKMKNGETAAEEYLQALLLCYVSMGTPGLNKDASVLAEILDASQLALYMNELFDKWMEEGAEAKKRWVLYAASIHGGEEIIKKLYHQIQEWPQHARGAIASDAVQALALSPSPQALLMVDGISRKFKFKQVKAAAGKALEFAASQRGLSREELEDKIVPDLGFDENMERLFDYGERSFKVTITPALEIEVFDEKGKRLKNMPSPGKRDQEEKALAAYEDFKQMKKQMKTTVSSQKMRLEQALSTGRQWSVKAWKELFVKNPVMHQFAIGLIWGIYEEQNLVQSFRYMEDGSFNTEEEDEFLLPEEGKIGLVHPIELTEESKEAWSSQLEDYEITQPIEQINRPVYKLTEEEAEQKKMERLGGYMINDLSLGGKLQTMGWYHGSVLDGGGFCAFYREDALGLGTELHFSGSFIGGSNEDVTIYEARFYRAGTIAHGSYTYEEADDSKSLLLKDVPPRYFSEIVLQLTKAAASSKEKNTNWRAEAYRNT